MTQGTIKAIIIDDEQKGIETLQKLIQDYCQQVDVVATSLNIHEAYSLILLHKPHVVFLDVEMPEGDGFSLLGRFIERDFQIIMTTAFDEYALKAIKHHAFDYLLKPIDINELIFAVDCVKKILKIAPGIEQTRHQKLTLASRLALPVKEGFVYLTVGDIVRIESDEGYSVFHNVDGKKYIVSKHLKDYEEMLPEKEFFRIHKSHLINVKKVKKYIRTEGTFIEMEDGTLVEIARRKKDEFLQVMSELS